MQEARLHVGSKRELSSKLPPGPKAPERSGENYVLMHIRPPPPTPSPPHTRNASLQFVARSKREKLAKLERDLEIRKVTYRETPSSATECLVVGLKPGKQYRFHVASISAEHLLVPDSSVVSPVVALPEAEYERASTYVHYFSCFQ